MRFFTSPHRVTRALVCVALAASTACDGNIDPPPGVDTVDPPFVPVPAQMRRLTDEQYGNLVRDALPGVVVPPRIDHIPSEGGLEATATSSQGFSSRGVEKLEGIALQIAEQAMEPGEARDALMPCDPTGTVDPACAERFLRRVARRVWRRPATRTELDSLVAIAGQSAETVRDFHQGLGYALAAVLQSPRAIFRVEFGTGTPEATHRPLDGWEIAERLAFFLWNTGPDEALLDAAAGGELEEDATLAAWVDRMLEDERSHQGVRAFFTDMLQLAKLDALSMDTDAFEHFGPDVGPAAREETLRVLEDIVFGREDYRTLMTRRETWLNRRLASIYGVRAPAPEGFARFTFPADSPRIGILGHVSTLAGHAHFGSTSPTLRGLFVRQRLLCGTVPPPPVGVETIIPEASEEEDIITLRQRVQKHLEDPVCANCHRLMDPLGLGLENFNAIGQYRTLDNGAPIDASGVVNGEDFEDAVGMAETIAQSEEFPRCLTRTAYRYALGHDETPGEAVSINGAHRVFTESGFQVLELLRAIALSEGFRAVGPPSDVIEIEEEVEE